MYFPNMLNFIWNFDLMKIPQLIFILWLGVCFTQTADVDNNKSLSNISDKKKSIGIGFLTYKKMM